jgi:hypothetical protein
MEGLVYEAFDAPRHVREPKDVPTEGVSVYFGLDFGWTNPLCFLRGVLDSNDVLWIDGEHYQAKLLIEDHEPLMRPPDARHHLRDHRAVGQRHALIEHIRFNEIAS